MHRGNEVFPLYVCLDYCGCSGFLPFPKNMPLGRMDVKNASKCVCDMMTVILSRFNSEMPIKTLACINTDWVSTEA